MPECKTHDQNPYRFWGISDARLEQADRLEEQLSPVFARLEAIRAWNQMRVLRAMQDARLSDSGFAGTTGYGYDDRGREQLEQIYAQVFEAESALVRTQICSGTQALAVALFGVLRTGDQLLSITGAPYDTLAHTIGLNGAGAGEGSLREFGITYDQVELDPQSGGIDLPAVLEHLRAETRMVLIQRSRGYAQRRALSIAEIGEAVFQIHSRCPDVVVLVDNCYGEFTEYQEPTAVGADLCVGSLIKNPGGGLAPVGGYIVGKQNWVEACANRLYAPGLGSHPGPTLGLNRSLIQGFYQAPHMVGECLKGLTFAAALFAEEGFQTAPKAESPRSDIIQTITFGDRELMLQFCQSIQAAAPVDAFVTPEPWDMPGYDCPVIMAAGAFVQGASIELSADGPVKPPYVAYLQGGLVYENVKLAALLACQRIRGGRAS